MAARASALAATRSPTTSNRDRAGVVKPLDHLVAEPPHRIGTASS
jgi:hypothetical protein